jgi:putative endonuclease
MRPPRRASTTERRTAEAAGRRGERLAGWWLRLKGWTVLDRRVRTPAGEVDLVARKDGLIAFVEVKMRRTVAELDFAIDERRLARVAAAAELLMPRYARDAATAYRECVDRRMKPRGTCADGDIPAPPP